MVENGIFRKNVTKKCNNVTLLKKSVTPFSLRARRGSSFVLHFYTFFSKLLREGKNKNIKSFCEKKCNSVTSPFRGESDMWISIKLKKGA